MTIGAVWHRPFTLVRAGLVVLLCLFLMPGCSGGGDPAGADLRTGNPSRGDISQNPAIRMEDKPGFSSQESLTGPKKLWVDDEVLVVLREGLGQSDIASKLAGFPVRLKKTIRCRWATVYELLITDGTPVPDLVKRLKADPDVRYADPNILYEYAEAPYVPNDPLWESGNPGDDPRDNIFDQWGPAKIGADLVWNAGKGSSDIVIALIDTGILKDHEDLKDNLWINEDEVADNGIDDDDNGYVDDTWGWDFADGDNDPTDEGFAGSLHGTACAGVAAAVQDNLKGLSGIAPGIRLMALRTSFGEVWESAAVEAVNYAVENGAAIISMSFGGTVDGEIFHATLDDAWNEGSGLNLLACAQNYDTTTPYYPAAYDSVMAVGATVAFSNSGEPIDEKRITKYEDGYWWGSNYGDWLSVMGFGEKYITTSGTCPDCYHDGINQSFFKGTSCATPMAAGVMALIRSFEPGHTSGWYRDRLKDTADDIGDVGFDIQTGYGRINAFRAMYPRDRFINQEDPLGFVPLDLPETQIFDTIHDVPGNVYRDIEDLYKFTMTANGSLDIKLDIFTWGENLDLALYADNLMTHLVAESTGPNHADSSIEEIYLDVSAGTQYYLRVYSAGPGNSTTYGLHIQQMANGLTVTGESVAPQVTHQQAKEVPFLKLTFDIGYQATLDEVIINKHGTLPSQNWTMARLYRDSNDDGAFDQGDEMVTERFPQAMNRMILGGLGISWTCEKPLVLFFAADFTDAPNGSTASFSLESYKDVTTAEGIEAPYDEFPIASDTLEFVADTEPPEWVSTVGIQTAQPLNGAVRIGWNRSTDSLSPPVKYNVYYTDKLPFDSGATRLADVHMQPGVDTDCQYVVANLPAGVSQYFMVRAEDQAGNEDENTDFKSCQGIGGADPENPSILNSYPLVSPRNLSVSGGLLVVADGAGGLKVFDRSDPANLEQVAAWQSLYPITDVVCDGPYAYCVDVQALSVIDLSKPAAPKSADSVALAGGSVLGGLGNWIYAVSNQMAGILPVDVSDPYNVGPYAPAPYWGSGTLFDVQLTSSNLYLAFPPTGIEAFDLSDPASPSYVGTFGDARSLAIDGSTIYSVNSNPGVLTSYDIGADPVNPPVLDSITQGPGIETTSVVIRGEYAYVARSDYGLVVFGVSNPSDMQYVGGLAQEGMMGLATDGTYVYGLRVVPSTGDGRLDVIL